MLKNLLLKNRSYRRFQQEISISNDTLKELVELARLCPSARNSQPLRYVIVNTTEANNALFKCLSWAGYITDWDGPEEGEQPAAYIVIVSESDDKFVPADYGIAAQSILLGAVEKGYGGCMVAAVKKEQAAAVLDLPENYKIQLVIALGKPNEQVVLEEMRNESDFKYYRDEHNVHHVPKRKAEEAILKVIC